MVRARAVRERLWGAGPEGSKFTLGGRVARKRVAGNEGGGGGLSRSEARPAEGAWPCLEICAKFETLSGGA